MITNKIKCIFLFKIILKHLNHLCCDYEIPTEKLEKYSIETNLTCNVCTSRGLGKSIVFKNRSALAFHMRKMHKLEQMAAKEADFKTIPVTRSAKSMENCTCKYFCPAVGCKRALNGLPSFCSLKYHYIRNHRPKTFKCACNTYFSIEADYKKHVKNE